MIIESRTDLIYLVDYEIGPKLQVFYAFPEHSTMVLLIHLATGNQTLKFHLLTPNKELRKTMPTLEKLFKFNLHHQNQILVYPPKYLKNEFRGLPLSCTISVPLPY